MTSTDTTANGSTQDVAAAGDLLDQARAAVIADFDELAIVLGDALGALARFGAARNALRDELTSEQWWNPTLRGQVVYGWQHVEQRLLILLNAARIAHEQAKAMSAAFIETSQPNGVDLEQIRRLLDEEKERVCGLRTGPEQGASVSCRALGA
jgi:hypothetical protein